LEALKALFEALKTTTYGVTAILLPGAAVLELLKWTTPLYSVTIGFVAYTGTAFICGAAVQGVASVLFSMPVLRKLTEPKGGHDGERHAQRILEEKLGEKIELARVLDLCLSAVDAKRDIYDKFVALRDMSRGLALTSLLAAAVLVIRHHSDLGSARYGLSLTFSVLGAVGFVERYRRFSPLGRQAVYAQFIASEMNSRHDRLPA